MIDYRSHRRRQITAELIGKRIANGTVAMHLTSLPSITALPKYTKPFSKIKAWVKRRSMAR
jgi:hypothetical protein